MEKCELCRGRSHLLRQYLGYFLCGPCLRELKAMTPAERDRTLRDALQVGIGEGNWDPGYIYDLSH